MAFRKKIYRTIEELQKDLDNWINYYNNERTHYGKYCYGKTPMQTFLDSKHLVEEKLLETLLDNKNVLTLGNEGNKTTQKGISDTFSPTV